MKKILSILTIGGMLFFGVSAHAMNKAELISAIKEAKGILETGPKRSNSSIREIKKKIKELKEKKPKG